ncbi:PUA-like domain-containing protein [Xylariales sp. PMI_506]|nr:PUA-like domain-containing protein [Xylariales sp. PMI_506]
MSAVDPERPDVLALMAEAAAALSATGEPALPRAPKDVFHFGAPSNPAGSDALLALAIAGEKTATTSWPVPNPLYWGVGDYSVILDGRGKPAAVMRTTSMVRCLFRDVEESFALAEAEGTYEDYREGHLDFYRTQQERKVDDQGKEFGDDSEVLCERFVVVYVRKGFEDEKKKD